MYQIQGYPQRMKVYWIPEKLPILDDLAKDKTYLQPEESKNVRKNKTYLQPKGSKNVRKNKTYLQPEESKNVRKRLINISFFVVNTV